MEATTALDPLQLALMQEECMVVDDQDRVVGHASKKECHLWPNLLPPRSLLHRAFSVFIFDGEHRLLLQKRSNSKITFPATWTNACCSHPLWEISGEREEAAHLGVKRAAVRKCKDELGIDSPDLLHVDSLQFMTRIHYLAPSGGAWGEHEIDSILVFVGDVPLTPNPEEVSDVRYVTPDELRAMRADPANYTFTPWFSLIEDTFLRTWWEGLDRLPSLQELDTIHRL